jgi:hypothetical protein
MDRRQLLAFPLLALVSQAARADLERPTYKVGDSWRFVNGDGTAPGDEFGHKVIAVGEEGIVVEGTSRSGNAFSTRVSLEMNPLRLGNANQMLVRFPLAVGANWDARYKVDVGARAIPRDYKLTRRVRGIERLKVPAGELECYRIDSNGVWSGDRGHNGNFEEHYWYSPQARYIAKYFARRWEKSGVGRAIVNEDAWVLSGYSVS